MEQEYFFSNLTAQVYKRLRDKPELKAIIDKEKDKYIDVVHNRYSRLIKDDLDNGISLAQLEGRLKGIGYTAPVWIATNFNYQWRKAYYNEAYDILKPVIGYDCYWVDVMGVITQGDLALGEIFIRLVEEQEQTQIKDVAHLQDLTGITDVWGHEEGVITTQEQAEAEALRQLTAMLNEGRLYRYLTAVEEKLRSGALYPEVAAIELADYGLADTFTADGREYNKERSIGHAIALATDLLTKEDSVDLKALARELQAPYTVLLAANDVRNELLTEIKGLLR